MNSTKRTEQFKMGVHAHGLHGMVGKSPLRRYIVGRGE